ncbi:MAG: hypothetical protein PWP22_1045 [Thermoanaerobacter sp.]|nr:hypothetical protein [Thermoanaerobacter sp.]
MNKGTTKLILIWSFSLLFLISLYVNIVLLHYQTDPFIPTTIKIAQLVSKFGSLESAQQYVTGNWHYSGWQGHTIDFLRYEPLSGILVYEISSVTGFKINTVAYFPLPLLIYVIMLYIISKLIYNLLPEKIKIEKNIMIFVLSVGMYAYIGRFVMGTFYVLEYHGIYYVYALMLYYSLFKIIQDQGNYQNSTKLTFLIAIVFLANLFDHYEIPITFTGGVIIFAVVVHLFDNIFIRHDNKLQKKLRNLIIIFMILILSNPFYYGALTRSAGLIQTVSLFFSTLANRLIEPRAGGQVTQLYPYANYLLLSIKMWHLGFLVIIISHMLFLTRLIKKNKNVSVSATIFLYILILGQEISWIISYFSMYLSSFALQLKNAWLLNSLVIIPLLFFNRTISTRWKRIGMYILVTTLTLTLVTWTIIYMHMTVEGYSPYSGQVKQEVRTVSFFLQNEIEDHYGIITGSLQSTSTIYEDLSLDKLAYWYPVIGSYFMQKQHTKFHLPVYEIYLQLKQNANIFVISTQEFKNGLYPGLYVAPLNRDEVESLNKILVFNENSIYTSDLVRIYMLQK